jgi:tetratricopeptide (TPR) repeat protein
LISTTEDGRQRFDFINPREDQIHVLIRGREIDRPEAFRIGEVPILPFEVVSSEQVTRRDNMLKAMEEYRRNPEDEPLLINYARTLAWYGRTRDALDLYSEGLRLHPTSYRLLRHRGHRYLSNRLFEKAVDDLGRSADLLEGQWASVSQPDEAAGHDASPRAYLRAIWYHLGVALYMARDLPEAERALKRSMEVAADDDQRCASAYWLVNTLIRLNRAEEIPDVLEFVSADMEIDANLSYSELVMLHAGLRNLEETLDINDATHPRFATLGYGVSNWLRLQGREEDARALLQRILTTDAVMNFGFIAAEVQLHEEGL